MMKKKFLVAFAAFFSLCFSMAGCAGPSTSETSKEKVASNNASISEGPISKEQNAVENSAAAEEGKSLVANESNLKTTTFNLNGVSFTMILVEGGTFTMGSNTRLEDQAPEHRVTLTSYLVGETEVTQALWKEVMGSNPSAGNRGDDYPVENVTWTKCHEFVEKLNQRMHEESLIPDDVNFHMPSEAQWENAAKGGNQSKGYTYAGSNTLSKVGWTNNENGRVSHKTKQKAPNELGLYDMSGNVYEWVADYYAPYSEEDQTNPCNLTNINFSRQVVKRGGSFWYNDEYRYTCTYRYAYYEDITDESIGVRICLY